MEEREKKKKKKARPRWFIIICANSQPLMDIEKKTQPKLYEHYIHKPTATRVYIFVLTLCQV